MPHAYANNGATHRLVRGNNDLRPSEVYFDTPPSVAQLSASFQNYQPPIWQADIAKTRAALAQSDLVVLRCYEAAIPVPKEWVDYRKALRICLQQGASLPTAPISYPADT